MVSKRYVRKYYSRRRFRRYRSVSNTYFKAKVEGVYTISYPSQSGNPVFAETNLPTVSFSSLYSSSQYYGFLSNVFGYYKVSGITMEVVPGANNFKGITVMGIRILLGFRCGKATAMTFNELVADNNSILLGVDTTKRKYTSTMGSNGWVPTGDANVALGAFSVASSETSTYTEAPSWTCRLSVYMLFKKSNI